jgi:hypothetical protein
LDGRLTSGNAPERINISTDFRRYCETKEKRSLAIDDLIERQKPSLVACLDDYIKVWDAFYLPSPIDFLGKGGEVLITYKHEKYVERTGRPALPPTFGEVHEWIGDQTDRKFLFVCACELVFMGAKSVYITDRSGDEGVDLIAKFEHSCFSGLTLFVQAKTSGDLISRDLLLAEYGKYQIGRTTAKFATYLEALGVTDSGCGHGPVYCFMANTGFKDSTKSVARSLGILLRGRKQLAFSLSTHFGMAKIAALRAAHSNLSSDLKRNWVHLLK